MAFENVTTQATGVAPDLVGLSFYFVGLFFVFLLFLFIVSLPTLDIDFSRLNPITKIENKIAIRKDIKKGITPKASLADKIKFKVLVWIVIILVWVLSSSLSMIPKSLAMKDSANLICNNSSYTILKKGVFPFERDNLLAYLRPLDRDFYQVIACENEARQINLIHSGNRKINIANG